MTAIEKSTIKKQRDGVFNLLLKKTGITYKSLIEHAKAEFIIDNLDMITPAERKQFNMLHFG